MYIKKELKTSTFQLTKSHEFLKVIEDVIQTLHKRLVATVFYMFYLGSSICIIISTSLHNADFSSDPPPQSESARRKVGNDDLCSMPMR